MPTGTALSTTKRKFHRILDSISNASSTSLVSKSNHDKYNNATSSTTTLPATMDPPAKKPRIARPTSAYVSPSTRILTSQSPNLRAAAATTEQHPSTTTMNQERKPPNFAPWDREQFLARLKTYRHVDKWMGKPENINEVQWAKRGWSCVGKERVGCVGGCGKEVVISLESVREERLHTEEGEDAEKQRQADEEEDEDEWREKAQEQLVEKYREMIITSHDGGCLWRRKGCDDTIQRLPLAHHKSAIEDLRQRYTSLMAIASELPPDPSTPPGFNLSSISQKLSPLLHPPPPATTTIPPHPPPPPLNPSALALSLFGWQAEEAGHVIGLATCSACYRRLGLWLFRPSPSSSSQTTPSHPSSMYRLDVVSEHRSYCPWISPLAQNGPTSIHSSQHNSTSLDGLAGWEMLMRSVVNAANFRRQGDNGSGDGISGDEFNNHYQRTSKDVVGEKKRGGILDDDDGGGGGARSEVASRATTTETMTRGEGEEVLGRDERDRERWAKLKRLKQAFQVKRMGKRMGTGTGGADEGGKGRGKEGADEAGRSGGAESAG